MVVLVFGIVLLMVLGVGMVPLFCRNPTAATIWELVSRLLQLLTFGTLIFAVLPRFERIFLDFGVELPALTVMILSINDLPTIAIAFGLFVFILALVAEVGLYGYMQISLKRRLTANLLSGLTTGMAFLVLIVITVGVWLPATKLLNDLSTVVVPGR